MTMKFGDTYNFDKSFENVKSTFDRYDYVVGNLETVLTDGPFNGFPKFSTPKQFGDSLIKSGVNVFMLANNHICDMGVKGVKSTINYLESNDMLYTGVGVDSKSMPVFIGDIAIINYTNKMNVKVDGVVYNDLKDFNSVKKDIEYVKENGVKVIIFITHWGNEYETTHSVEQLSTAKKLINLGVNMIIGSHPHVIQDRSDINGCPIIFSMGNFISSQIEEECMRSIGVDVEIEDGKIVKTKYLNFQIENDNGIVKVKEI
jgi:poly-gamma-glutamate synthesis protein (capsule biosynthesis protein)